VTDKNERGLAQEAHHLSTRGMSLILNDNMLWSEQVTWVVTRMHQARS